MNLGENIHYFRTTNNLSQGELANSLSVSRQSISKWENNSALPELDKLVKMTDLFHITLDELVFGKKEEEPAPAGAPSVMQPAFMPYQSVFSSRKICGTCMLLFGMVFFLLSIFWGDHLRFGEEIGEFLSISIVVLSLAIIAPYNKHILAVSGVVYFLYSVVCFGILHVNSLSNYLFLTITGLILLVWFFVWGNKASKEAA